MMKVKELIKKIAPGFLLDFYHCSLAVIGAFLYGFPGKKMAIIGITGTSGKSTVVELAARILEEAGFKVASLSSIKFKIGERKWPNTLKMTMPGRFKLQKFLRQTARAGCGYVILEVTSEGIKQYRHKFIKFNTAIFTNLSPEHIESHGGFEKYRDAKLKLFKAAKNIHIINFDDENAKYFLRIPAEKKWLYSFQNSKLKIDWKLESNPPGSPPAGVQGNWKFIKATDIKIFSSGISFKVNNIQFNLNFLGGFNIYNALAAICVGLSHGISLETCSKALAKAKGVPGRMEIVIKEPFTVIVDYAHTPTALEKVYKTLKGSSLICVLGSCGGGRDKWKRPVMGGLAAKYCKEIIITNEDPYDENPLKIMEDIESGFSQIPDFKLRAPKYEKILDRREAIKKALKLARPNDTVIITGKGCEPWMCVAGGKKVPWDDRKVVKEEFQKLKK